MVLVDLAYGVSSYQTIVYFIVLKRLSRLNSFLKWRLRISEFFLISPILTYRTSRLIRVLTNLYFRCVVLS